MSRSSAKPNHRTGWDARVMFLVVGALTALAGLYVVVKDDSYAIISVIVAGAILMFAGLLPDKEFGALKGAVPALIHRFLGPPEEEEKESDESNPPAGDRTNTETGQQKEIDVPSPLLPAPDASALAAAIRASNPDAQLEALEEAWGVHDQLDAPGRRELLGVVNGVRTPGETRKDPDRRQALIRDLRASLENRLRT